MVGKRFLWLPLLLLASIASAQGPSSAQIEANKGNLKQVTVAQLANANKTLMYRVTDGASASDCSTGLSNVQVVCYWDGSNWVAANGTGGGGAPTDATYITQTANGSLTNEQALGSLATGCLGSTTTTGVVAARTITGTANEVSVANGDCSGAPTISLPATIDLGGKTSFEVPNGAAPTTNAFGQIAGDNDAWAASRGAPQWFDGTANTYLVGILASDTCTNGQVPTWNTGGTWTCETPATGSGITLQCKGAPAAATAGTSEEVLATCSLSANTLSAAGHAIRVGLVAHTAANANAKEIRVRVGGIAGTVVLDSGSIAANGQTWITTGPVLVSYLTSSTATARASMGRGSDGTNVTFTTNFGGTALKGASIDWTSALDVVITGQTPTSAGDLTLDTYQVELLK